jgi:hypothetical protein
VAELKVRIIVSGSAKMTPVLLPDDIPMSRLIPALVTKLNLPASQAGQPLSHALDNKRTGMRLGENDTLQSAGVQVDDVLTLLPTPTAGCFLAGTMVTLPDGTQTPIECLREGDRVLTVHQRTGAISSSDINKVFNGLTTEYFSINSALMVTGSHLVYATGRWKPVRDLVPGDLLCGTDGEPVEMKQLTRVASDEPSPIYNLHLAQDHTFFANSILVHNAQSKALPFDLVDPIMHITPKDIPANVPLIPNLLSLLLPPSVRFLVGLSIFGYSVLMFGLAAWLYLANRSDHLILLKIFALLLCASIMFSSAYEIALYESQNHKISIGVLVLQFLSTATLTLEIILLILLT